MRADDAALGDGSVLTDAETYREALRGLPDLPAAPEYPQAALAASAGAAVAQVAIRDGGGEFYPAIRAPKRDRASAERGRRLRGLSG